VQPDNSADFRVFLDTDSQFMHSESILRSGEGTASQLEGILKYIDEHTEERLRANAERLIAWVQFRAADADR
jgi:hypothetical protein